MIFSISAIVDKGILRPSGEVVKNKINLISGAHTQPFAEMLWTVTGGDTDTTDRVYTLLSDLYQEGRETEMLEVLRTLYGVLGLAFPDDVELLAGHPEARSYFLTTLWTTTRPGRTTNKTIFQL